MSIAIASRRRLLQAFAGLAACPVCLGLDRGAAAAEGPHWGYEGEAGPARWGELSPEWQVCGTGRQQSPIDLVGAVPAEIEPLRLGWGEMALAAEDIGHTFQLTAEPGSTLELEGRAFRLLQFHFHHPSEHAVDGVRTAMEAHFVHLAEDGGLAVLGVFLDAGEAGAPWQAVFAAMAGEADRKVDLAALLPADRAYWRYAGSLTTPPCAETVDWLVLRAHAAAPADGIARFAARFPDNARSLQARHRRFLLEGG